MLPSASTVMPCPALKMLLVAAEAGDDLPVKVSNTDPLAALGDVGETVPDVEIVRAGHVPLREVLACAVEHLDAVVGAVADVDAAVIVNGKIVDGAELAWPGALTAPGVEQARRPG